jgi:heavy metal sensor kinase
LNIRTRLAGRFALVVASMLLVYAGVVYAFSAAMLDDQLDTRLHEDFEAAEHGFTRAADGELSWTSTYLPGHETFEELPELPWAEVRAPEGRTLRRAAGTGLEPARTYSRDYVREGIAFRVTVGRSEVPMRRQRESLLRLLMNCLSPLVLLSFLVGRWLAGRALAPVEAMTERARAISAERLSERLEVPNANDELGRLAAVFNKAFARIERSFEALRRFTSDASHELRTPLAALRSVGEVGLRQARTPEELREVVGSMLEESERLARVVDGLLTLSRAEAGRTPVERERVVLAEAAREIVGQLTVLAEEKGQTLVVEGDLDVAVPADRRLLRHALVNLIDNAIKYGPAGSRVRIEVRKEAEGGSVAVHDEGPGIPAEHRDHVFERFYRVDPARSRDGVGLGLAIARWAVEAQGGRVALESSAGVGSTFRILLPAEAAAPPQR